MSACELKKGIVDMIKSVMGQDEKYSLRPYFIARCKTLCGSDGVYRVRAKNLHRSFIFDRLVHDGNDFPLVSGKYKSLDQLIKFHLCIQIYRFNVEPKWTHHVDGSLVIENPFWNRGEKLHVASLHYWKCLTDTLNEPSFWRRQMFDHVITVKSGDRVWVKRKGKKWILGTVIKVKKNFKYSIDCDDGDCLAACPRGRIKAAEVKLSSFLACVNGESFKLRTGWHQMLSFGHVDQLRAIQSLLRVPAVNSDFSHLQNFEPDGKFTVRSGSYQSLAHYKKKNAVLWNSTLEEKEGGVSRSNPAFFKGWEDYLKLNLELANVDEKTGDNTQTGVSIGMLDLLHGCSRLELFLEHPWIFFVSCRNSNFFTTSAGFFKSVQQWKALQYTLASKFCDVYGHTASGRFRMRENFGANFPVRYDRFTNKMLWINNKTGENYNREPPCWYGPKAKYKLKWEELGQDWWGLIRSKLKRLTPAEAIGMEIMETQFTEWNSLSWNIAVIIASFLVSEGLQLGDRVRVRRREWTNSRWYNGTIKSINYNGTYAVKYDDGDYWCRCPISKIQKLQEKN